MIICFLDNYGKIALSSSSALFAEEKTNIQHWNTGGSYEVNGQIHYFSRYYLGWAWIYNHYKIGSTDYPVTVDEYVAFLMTGNAAKESWKRYSDYYDSNFMEDGTKNWEKGKSFSAVPSIRYTGKNGAYVYSVIEGCGNNVIDSVQSEVASKEFAAWRKNPAVIELVDYCNYKINAVIPSNVDDGILHGEVGFTPGTVPSGQIGVGIDPGSLTGKEVGDPGFTPGISPSYTPGVSSSEDLTALVSA